MRDESRYNIIFDSFESGSLDTSLPPFFSIIPSSFFSVALEEAPVNILAVTLPSLAVGAVAMPVFWKFCSFAYGHEFLFEMAPIFFISSLEQLMRKNINTEKKYVEYTK